MLIHVPKAKLFDNQLTNVYVNPVNTVGVSGAGLAKEFKVRYPVAQSLYEARCRSGFRIGELMFVRERNDMVVYFPTKIHWRQPSQLEYIERGLERFVKEYARFNMSSVAFPALGCGLGGLNWQDDVLPLMLKVLANVDLLVYLHYPLEAYATR